MRHLISLFLLALAFASCASAQEVLSQSELQNLLDKGHSATQKYTEVFKNLSAEENKTFEDYDKNGKVIETRRIKSNFIVYRSPRSLYAGEFRNVTDFNGKSVVRKDDELSKFFEKLAKADSNTEEWKKLRAESGRFDGRSGAWGLTLWQDSPLGNTRPFFEFQVIGKEKIEGRDVIIIEYRQVQPTLLIKADPTEEEIKKEPQGRQYNISTPNAFRPTNPRLFGRLWLDAETAQIWRNELKIMLNPARLSNPVMSEEILYEYQWSEFKILVPKKFVLLTYRISGTNDKNLSVIKDRSLTYEYSKFAEIKTEIQKYEIGK